MQHHPPPLLPQPPPPPPTMHGAERWRAQLPGGKKWRKGEMRKNLELQRPPLPLWLLPPSHLLRCLLPATSRQLRPSAPRASPRTPPPFCRSQPRSRASAAGSCCAGTRHPQRSRGAGAAGGTAPNRLTTRWTPLPSPPPRRRESRMRQQPCAQQQPPWPCAA